MLYSQRIAAAMENIVFLNPKNTSNLLSEGGALSSLFKNYEVRESQIALTENICRCFNEESVGVFEAGTGVGKSFAYLLPAIQWAKKNKTRVIIATATINLQSQLVEKDVPAAMKILGEEYSDIKTELVKGRQNYICLRRLFQAGQEQDLFDTDKEQLEMLVEWAKNAESGSRSELDFLPSESVWRRACGEADNCLMSKCPYFRSCFVMKMKRKAEEASILIANHHLLFADLESRADGAGYDGNAVMPAFTNIIFDEAHGIETAAQSFFSKSLSRYELLRQLNTLYRLKRGKKHGFLVKILSLSGSSELFISMVASQDKILALYNRLENFMFQTLENIFKCGIFQLPPASVKPLLKHIEDFYEELKSFNAKLSVIISKADEDLDDEDVIRTCKICLRRLESLAQVAENFLYWDKFEEDVFWFERKRGGAEEFFEFIQTPVDIAKKMQKAVFEPMSSVICVSATLRVGGSFDFWLRSVGLKFFQGKPIITAGYPSPFLYSKNVLLAIPSDIPMPDEENFQSAVNSVILNLIEITKGKTLVLFTSYTSLQASCGYARENIKSAINIFKQGEEDRARLLNKFKEDIESCLFATTSFWEGVDIPGEALSHVILVKLPFSVPTDPIFKAKSCIIERAGGSSFMQLSIPEAATHFKQGFGRLIRTNTDRGIVTVLDKRLLVKRYGKFFINSIPKTRRCFATLEEIMYNIGKFLNKDSEDY